MAAHETQYKKIITLEADAEVAKMDLEKRSGWESEVSEWLNMPTAQEPDDSVNKTMYRLVISGDMGYVRNTLRDIAVNLGSENNVQLEFVDCHEAYLIPKGNTLSQCLYILILY